MPERTDLSKDDGTDPGRVDAPVITEPLATPPDPRARVREETGIGIGLADDLRAVRTTLVKAHLSRVTSRRPSTSPCSNSHAPPSRTDTGPTLSISP